MFAVKKNFSFFSSLRGYLSLLSIILLLIGFLAPRRFYAQEVNAWATTPLSSPLWEGTKDKFQLQEGVLSLSDSAPQARNNRAWLFYPYAPSPSQSLQGEITFNFTPTSYNYFYLLLFPYTPQVITSEGVHQDYVALLVGKDKVTQWVTVRTTKKAEGQCSLSLLSTLLSDSPLYNFDTTPNHLAWRLSWSTNGECTLWLNTYNSLRKEMRRIGSLSKEESLKPIDAPSQWGVYFCYTQRNAKAWQLLNWKNTESPSSIEDPTPEEEQSLFYDLSYAPQRLTLQCKRTFATHRMRATLEPYDATIRPAKEGDLLHLYLEKPLLAGRYRLTLTELYTIEGNPLPEESFIFSLEEESPPPTPIEEPQGDEHPLLSEVMYYPRLGGSEYIELFNPSHTSLDLSLYGIALRNEGRLGKIYPIRGKNTQIPSGQYKAITPWSKDLIEHFATPTDSLIEVSRFPNLPNHKGQIVLLRLADTLCLEEVIYAPEGKERQEELQGMAWARISFEKPAEEPTNWYRVRGDQFYGSPGRHNTAEEEFYNENEKNSETPRTPQEVARFVLRNEREKGFRATAFWYNTSGERIALYDQQQLLLWCRNLLNGKGELPYRAPHTLLILSVELRTGAMKKSRKMHLFFR
ncbi:lamin tail domain-containing protein [Porphyromonas circumdentaria]|uniref:Lamin Tail Domain n=1 Tax=Porphyromonas circumdentaria TaxID=29524 RepID=A0A1T4PNJ4_9PORP|nr:lamin tail domain-containing protein [Porphyromonas circumdentaria]SJZ92901.1 hypothetical protein SAMN02745171_01521 [Porphyromonas circumdentaria]